MSDKPRKKKEGLHYGGRSNIELSCGHVRLFWPPYPKAGEEITCVSCNWESVTVIRRQRNRNKPRKVLENAR